MSNQNRSRKAENEKFQPIVPLVPPKPSSEAQDRTNFITFELKVIAGSDSAGKYKKQVRLFDDGTPDEFITTLNDLDDIFKQNKVEQPSDQNALIESVLKATSKENYITFMEEVRGLNKVGKVPPIEEDSIEEAIQMMCHEIFPYRALDRQKSWMKRNMRKPTDLPPVRCQD